MCNETKRPVLKVGDKVTSRRWGEGEVVCILPKPTRYRHEVVIQISRSGEIVARKKDGRSASGDDYYYDFDKIPKKKTLYCFIAKSDLSGKYYIELSDSDTERQTKIKRWSREGIFVILNQHEREIEVED